MTETPWQVLGAEGLTEAERSDLRDLLTVWQAKLSRNRLKNTYYEQKNRLRDLGIAIPPTLRDVEEIVGWPSKAVDQLAVRSVFDGFSFADGQDRLGDVVEENSLELVYTQAVTDELINSVAFLTVSKGGSDEPDVVISAYSALNASALWHHRLKRIRCGMAVIDVEQDPTALPEPTWVNLYTDTQVVEVHKRGSGWEVERHPHQMGRPTMEPLAYRPRLDRPFGKSRITRAVMSITDNAVREQLRTEIASELFSVPQRYMLGADEQIFQDKTKWEAYIGSFLALTKDSDGDVPTVGQFSPMSMQPHVDYMRDLAARFSGETGVPISELGVIHDNPASAEAIYAAKESLVIEAETLNKFNGKALCRVARMALAMMGDKPLRELDDDERAVRARFKNPARPSIVSQADAIVKLSSAIPGIAESEVALEEAGFDSEQIERIEADRDKARAQALIDQQTQAQGQPQGGNMYKIASILKSYRAAKISSKNAITLFATIGIGEAEARDLLADAEDVGEAAGVDDAGDGAASGDGDAERPAQ